jgi:hypothetical protein
MKFTGRVLLFLFFSWIALSDLKAGEIPSKDAYKFHVRKTEKAIRLDGRLEEEAWKVADSIGRFYQNFPFDTSYALANTSVWITYDETYLYIGAVCYDDNPGNYIIQSLKRDFLYSSSDAFAIYIDPFMDGTNGFCFAVNPYGVQQEGLLSYGGSFGPNNDWDNQWFSKVSREAYGWVAEIAIPFRTLRYNRDLKEWGINFSRNDLKRNESSSWCPVPRNFKVGTLAFNGKMIWEDDLPRARNRTAIIPFATWQASRDYTRPGGVTQVPGIGTDAKIAVTSSLNLDLTVNPDFSQVEVDRQVTNLSRFSIFFPERRQFFIENSDLFSNFGFRNIRPFFSRKIGIIQNFNSLPEPVRILGGGRLSGRLDENWRMGAMSMQTEGRGDLGLQSQNYSVLALQRQMFTRSNISAILVNRQGFEGNRLNPSDFNRVLGVDYNLATADNRLRGKIFYHHLFTPGQQKNNSNAQAVWLNYSSRRLMLEYNHEYIGENYNPEVGFVLRSGVIRTENIASYKWFPAKGKINNHGPAFYMDLYTDKKFVYTDGYYNYSYQFKFNNSAIFSVNWNEIFTWLLYPFDPSGLNRNPLPEGKYYYRNVELTGNTDVRKKLTFSGTAGYGSYFNGTRQNTVVNAAYRLQPYAIVGLSMNQNLIEMPAPFTDAQLWLVGPRVELSLSKSLFFTTFVQYNTQLDNLNINSRLQWRFRPMSDLFIVVTDNYLPYGMTVRNRAIVIKINYWFFV